MKHTVIYLIFVFKLTQKDSVIHMIGDTLKINSTLCNYIVYKKERNTTVDIMNQISTGYKNMTSAIDGNTTTEPSSMPREMSFTDDSLVSVVTYTVLFIIAAIGNLLVFITLLKHRHRRSRVNLFILHLCIADMIVTFIMLPMEIGWHLTVSWKAGDFGCRILMFFRAFGFYLSSFILIVISLDRYIAIAHPLSLIDAGRRGKVMLCFAWLCSLIASVPQVS